MSTTTTVAEIKREAIRARLQGGRIPVELGGQGWSMAEWFVVNETFGRVTNGLHWHVPSVYNVWLDATPEQFARYDEPALRGIRAGSPRRRSPPTAAAGGSTARSGSSPPGMSRASSS